MSLGAIPLSPTVVPVPELLSRISQAIPLFSLRFSGTLMWQSIGMASQSHSRFELENRLQLMRKDAEVLRELVAHQFGLADNRTIRAGEICDALQRLRWEFERQGGLTASVSQ